MKAPESLSITDYIPEGPGTQRGKRSFVEIDDGPMPEGEPGSGGDTYGAD